MLSTIAIQGLKPHMIDRQLRRRIALTPFDVEGLAPLDRNVSLAFSASARSIVHTAPQRAAESTPLFKFYRQTACSAEPHSG